MASAAWTRPSAARSEHLGRVQSRNDGSAGSRHQHGCDLPLSGEMDAVIRSSHLPGCIGRPAEILAHVCKERRK